MKTRTRHYSSQLNVLFILTSLFIALCLFIPVWQSAVSSQLKIKLAKQESFVNGLQDQQTTLKAGIESQKTPEYLSQMASANNIVFSQIPSQSAGTVASSL